MDFSFKIPLTHLRGSKDIPFIMPVMNKFGTVIPAPVKTFMIMVL